MKSKVELVETIAEKKARLGIKDAAEVIEVKAVKPTTVKTSKKSGDDQMIAADLAKVMKAEQRKLDSKPKAAAKPEPKAKAEKKEKKAKAPVESLTALRNKFAQGAAALYLGEGGLRKPWLTSKTPLTVVGVISCHDRPYVRLTAMRGKKEQTLHLSPARVAVVKKSSK